MLVCEMAVRQLVLVLALASLAKSERFIVLPGPSSRTSLQSLWKLSSTLQLRGHNLLFVTSVADRDVLAELQAATPNADVSVQLFQPYEGHSNLTEPVQRPFKKKSAATSVEKPKNDYEAFVHTARLWYATNCEAVMGSDPDTMTAMKEFNATHIIGDSAFVCFSHVADALGGLPKTAVATTLMPPMEQSLYGMTESVFEIPTYRSGLPRHMSLNHFWPQLKSHMSFTGPMKRTFKQLDEIARNKYGIAWGAGKYGKKDLGRSVDERLKEVQALILAVDPMMTAVPVVRPPHVHLVGPMAQPSAAGNAAEAQPLTLLLHVESWSSGPKALSAVLEAVAAYLDDPNMQVMLTGGDAPAALVEKLDSTHQATLKRIQDSGSVAMGEAGVAVVIFEGSPAVAHQAAYHGIPSVVLPVRGDQVDQAMRLEEAGVAIVLRKPDQFNGASAVSRHDLGVVSSAGAKVSEQTQVAVISAAISVVTGGVGSGQLGMSKFHKAAALLSQALQSRQRHPVDAAADVIEEVATRTRVLTQLAAVTGANANALLHKPGHADGGNFLMTTAFAAGFVFMMIGTLVNHYVSKKVKTALADAEAKRGENQQELVGGGDGGKDGDRMRGSTDSAASQLRKRR